ncbi:MAG: DUF5615 family PIN-like protein [Candidatus Omnitrophota bacterium]
MKLFADHCFFSCGTELLKKNGYDIIKAADAGLAKVSDERIVLFCGKENRIILTLDNDFNNLYRFPLGSHSGIVVFKISPFTPQALLAILAPLIGRKMFSSFKNALVIVGKHKVRIVRPGKSTETI